MTFKVDDILDMHFNNRSVVEMKLNGHIVWSQEDHKYLDVTPKYIWLVPENNFTDYAHVLSNIIWDVELK